MKVRVKYTKGGSCKFIGHLDVMRYFQKAVKRAGLDIAYSNGFSPHQLMSFAAPLALGMTSEGEYFDAEFHSMVSSDEFVKRMNAQMANGMRVNDVVLLPEHAKNSMSLVAASDYRVTLRDSMPVAVKQAFLSYVPKLLMQDRIEVLKKTKKSEKTEDIRSGIERLAVEDDGGIYMLLATGSEYNIKPELVLLAICEGISYPYDSFDYRIHRLETYTRDESGTLISLLETGTHIEVPIYENIQNGE